MNDLILPHGGVLSELMLGAAEAAVLKERSRDFPSLTLTPQQLSDLEMLLNGGFSPLKGFLGQADYHSVLEHMRLADGTCWPLPVMLAVAPQQAEKLEPGMELALREPQGRMLASLGVEEIWPSHATAEGSSFSDERVYLAGKLAGVALPEHHDYPALRLTPAALRAFFMQKDWGRIVACQTRQPLHRPQFAQTLQVMERLAAPLLLQPLVGPDASRERAHHIHMRCYQAVLGHYPPGQAELAILGLAQRGGGARELLLQAIAGQNFGCSHIICGQNDGSGEEHLTPSQGVAEAQKASDGQLQVELIAHEPLLWVPSTQRHVPPHAAPAEAQALPPAEVVRMLRSEEEIPPWGSFSEVLEHLRPVYLPRYKEGLTLFFTGLPGSGKSTLAAILETIFLQSDPRPVILLDGDIVRANLSSELGFSREHRDLNILRLGFVARIINQSGGIAICAPIAPYQATRQQVRQRMSSDGGFIEIHVATPLEECEKRDLKGLYAKARAGIISEFTGISDVYEVPQHPEIRIDTSAETPRQSAGQILGYLQREGYIRWQDHTLPDV